MTVLMTSDMPGTTQEGYDHLAATLVPTLQTSPGFIAHAAGPVEGGYLITELWESEQAHEAWFEHYVRSALPADAPAPSITYRPITNIATASRSID
jgi:heme-degrading monooxygenase HmoA